MVAPLTQQSGAMRGGPGGVTVNTNSSVWKRLFYRFELTFALNLMTRHERVVVIAFATALVSMVGLAARNVLAASASRLGT